LEVTALRAVALAALIAFAPTLALADDPPVVEHQPQPCMIAGKAISLCATVSDDNQIAKARLYFRPHDVTLLKEATESNDAAAFQGRVVSGRRHQGVARLEVELGSIARRVEIEVPIEDMRNVGERVSFQLNRWRLFNGE